MTFESSKSSANARHTQSQSQSDWRVAQHGQMRSGKWPTLSLGISFLSFSLFSLSFYRSFKAAKNILISLSCNIFISQTDFLIRCRR